MIVRSDSCDVQANKSRWLSATLRVVRFLCTGAQFVHGAVSMSPFQPERRDREIQR
jgi:hypothetical protein